MAKSKYGEFICNSDEVGAAKVLHTFGDKVIDGPPRATPGFSKEANEELVGLYLKPEYRLSDVEGVIE